MSLVSGNDVYLRASKRKYIGSMHEQSLLAPPDFGRMHLEDQSKAVMIGWQPTNDGLYAQNSSSMKDNIRETADLEGV